MKKLSSAFLFGSIALSGIGCQTINDNSSITSAAECEPLTGYEMLDKCFTDDDASADWALATSHQNRAFQYFMGLRFEEGKGVPQSFRAAYRFYNLAAEQGHAGAQNNLGRLYFYGRGIEKNRTRAYMWIKVAEKNPERNKTTLVDSNAKRLWRMLKPYQISEGKKLASQCIKQNYKRC